MIERKKFLTAFICVILSLLTALCFAFSGCAEYKPPEGGGDTPVIPVDPVDPENPDDPKQDEKGFSVQLVVKNGKVWQNFTSEYYDASDGKGGAHAQGWIYWDSIKVQWTDVESNARYSSPRDSDGKATRSDLDGDYKVTLTNVPTGFTYEPNQNYADNITKKIEIVLYKIQNTGATIRLWEGSDHTEFKAKMLNTTGAYSVTLKNKDDRVMFAFSANKQGTYSLTTLANVIENKINPTLSVYNGNLTSKAIYYAESKDDGGAENSYTKNVFWQYYISANEAVGANALIFELYSSSLDGNSSYPFELNFLIQRDGDFTREEYVTEEVKPTEDFTKTPETPAGTLTWAARNPVTDGLLLDSSKVILNTESGRKAAYLRKVAGSDVEYAVEMGSQATLNDGYYYFYNYDETSKTFVLTDRLYAVINAPNEIVDFTDPHMNFRFLQHRNYVSFINTYRQYCNANGAYPVNAELAQFLQDYCLSQSIFNDGAGLAETTMLNYVDKNGNTQRGHYNSDEKSMWMFGCAYYKQ